MDKEKIKDYNEGDLILTREASLHRRVGILIPREEYKKRCSERDLSKISKLEAEGLLLFFYKTLEGIGCLPCSDYDLPSKISINEAISYLRAIRDEAETVIISLGKLYQEERLKRIAP